MAKFDGSFFNNPTEYVIDKFQLGDGQKVQETIDSLCITYMGPYIPFKSGVLASSFGQTIIGSGKIIQQTPYAKYQYYGQLYVDPITGKGAFYNPKYGFWSRKGVNKILSDRKLNYDTSINQLAGPKWFERMKADHKQEILRQAEKVAKGKE